MRRDVRAGTAALAASTAAAALIACVLAPAFAQDTQKEVEKYERMIAAGSPVELFEAGGEELWKKPQGPNSVSLENCDLGKGPGVLKGAYSGLPRYFADPGQVMDLETRLLYCMIKLQGRSREEATRVVFGTEDTPSEMEYLSAYIAAQSRGWAMQPGSGHPEEQQAFELGRALFYFRAGPWDFACTSCHGEPGRRIRMQQLPALAEPTGAGPVVTTWPAYRVSNSQLKTMQWRIGDCYRQMRMPEPGFASEPTVAINMFLATNARGQIYRGPGTKR
jgi:sulfur-oxidizing protein SoxA